MPYMHILGMKVNVNCSADVSSKGIPYLCRELVIEQGDITYTVSVHVYPKTTTCLVFKDSGGGEWQGLYKIATLLYQQDAPTFIEQVLRVAERGDGMTKLWDSGQEHGIFDDIDYMGMSQDDWGDK